MCILCYFSFESTSRIESVQFQRICTCAETLLAVWSFVGIFGLRFEDGEAVVGKFYGIFGDFSTTFKVFVWLCFFLVSVVVAGFSLSALSDWGETIIWLCVIRNCMEVIWGHWWFTGFLRHRNGLSICRWSLIGPDICLLVLALPTQKNIGADLYEEMSCTTFSKFYSPGSREWICTRSF